MLMLHRMAFCSSAKVALQLDNSIAMAYVSNQGDKVPLFPSLLAYNILNLANKHSIILLLASIPTSQHGI